MLCGPVFSFAQTYEYVLDWDNPASHVYKITFTTDKAEGTNTYIQLPAWRPGRYIIQNYAAGVTNFKATDEKGNPLVSKKTGKETWEVPNNGQGRIIVSYDFYANVMDAGSSYLGTGEAYFNGSNLFMHVENEVDRPCKLTVPKMEKNWGVASSLVREKAFNEFSAPSYHDFVDAPTILSPTLKTLETKVNGVTFYLHFQGKFEGGKDTEKRLLADIEKIIKEQAAVFAGDIPMKEYHFIYHLLPYRYRHAVEHKYSSSYTLPDGVVASPEALSGMYGITSHEFWHLWNVKRIRPAALWPYDYQKEAYTSLHWFTEGVTDYYTNLALVRAGIFDEAGYLSRVSKELSRLENSNGSTVVAPAESSFDSWLSGSEYANPHYSASYYPLGSRVGLLLDLKLRADSKGKVSLDDVFLYLYNEYYKKDLGVPENGILDACTKVSGLDMRLFFKNYVDGTAPINYDEFLEPFGLKMNISDDSSATYERVGIDRLEKSGGTWYLHSVRPGGDADKAGLGDKDAITRIDGKSADQVDPNSFFKNLQKGKTYTLNVYRDGREEEVKLKYSGNNPLKNYEIVDLKKVKSEAKKLREDWLSSKVK